MAENLSALAQIKKLELYVLSILAALDIDALERSEQKLVVQLRQQFVDAKLDIRDHEYADTKAEQAQLSRVATKSIEVVCATILKASEHNMFSAIDVAELSAQLEQILVGIS